MKRALRTRAWQHSLVALLSACTQESFVLGALGKDAGPDAELDASWSPSLDAATRSDGGPTIVPSPMSVTLESRGRDHVIAISLGCGAECVAVRAKVAGGLPPYRITWDDGKEGATRTLCHDPLRPRGGVVQDASGGVNAPVSFSLSAVDYFPCDTEPSSYRTCFGAEPVELPCAGYDFPLSFDLGEPLQAGGHFSAEFVFHGPNLGDLPYVNLNVFSEACDYQNAYSGTQQVLSQSSGRSLVRFENYVDLEVQYLSLDAESLLRLPLGLAGDAGVPVEVESLVVCEYTHD